MPGTGIALFTLVVVPLLFMTAGLLHSRYRKTTLEGYISARNSIGPTLGMATLVATVMGSWILFSPAETATFSGLIGLSGYALGSAAPIIAFIWIGARMRRLMPEGHSLSEYVWYRFGSTMYLFVLGVMVFYMFVFLAAELTGIALAVKVIADIPLAATVSVLGIATLAYTAYGGLRATMFTDSVQFAFIAPLLLLAIVWSIVDQGGLSDISDRVREAAPALLSVGERSAWETGIALIIAILAANMFHQGYWQRVYACRDDGSLRRAFILTAVVVMPMVFIAGLFGLIAVGAEVAEVPSVALFSVVLETMPTVVVLLVMVLAIALVMSSADSLLNGLISSFTSDLHRAKPDMDKKRLLYAARIGTALIAGAAMGIATQGYSVLYMFLVADLVAAAVVVPVFLGLYLKGYGARTAIVSSVAGIAGGTLFFPDPDFQPWLEVPQGGNLMISFVTALFGSSLVAVVVTVLERRVGASRAYDMDRLSRAVKVIEE